VFTCLLIGGFVAQVNFSKWKDEDEDDEAEDDMAGMDMGGMGGMMGGMGGMGGMGMLTSMFHTCSAPRCVASALWAVPGMGRLARMLWHRRTR
jgi:predicted lipid-binding transport protein (Tim44 family)